MKNKEPDITAFIKQSLEGYHEDYLPGSWENFVHKRKSKNRRILYLISAGIAACLLIGFFISNLNNPVIMNDLVHRQGESPILKGQFPLATKKDTTTKAIAKLILNARIRPVKQSVSSGTQQLLSGKDTVPVIAAAVHDSTVREKVPIESDSNRKTDSLTRKIASRTLFNEPLEKNYSALSKPKRKVRFGINFSPGVSATISESSFNFSGGLTAEYPLSSTLRLSTGVQFENQNIVNKIPAIASSIPSVLSSSSKTIASLNNLDLPLNLTWRVFSDKVKSYYISAGVSSLLYLKQTYQNTTHTQQLVAVSTIVGGQEIISYNLVDMTTTTQKTVSPFRTIDFAGRLNFIFGFEQKLSPNLFLHLEPFVKIPMSGLASENIKYTTSGITFKVSF